MTDPPPPGPRGKRATRQTLLSRRDALTPAERDAASALICASASALLSARLEPGAVVALYAAKGSEVDTVALEALAAANGFVIAYPRVVDHERILAFHTVPAAELVVARRFGLREPLARTPEVALDQISAFIIPGLAFDHTGGRVGWGRGHYDATLAIAPAALRIGLAFECQLVESVPRDPHDILLHYLITETQTLAVA